MDADGRNEIYMECLRNHAASLGSYATDGCGEFTLDHTSSPPAITSFHCAACGCHRNFHRKVGVGGGGGGGGGAAAASARIADVTCRSRDVLMEMVEYGGIGGGGGKKRFRTKFTVEQKEKMLEFAEKLGWKLQRKDQEDEIERFCKGVGVSRQVFKVWMHNHKNPSSSSSTSPASTGNASSSLTQ